MIHDVAENLVPVNVADKEVPVPGYKPWGLQKQNNNNNATCVFRRKWYTNKAVTNKMSKIDALAYECFRTNERFADIFNAMVFGGKQVIHPEDLRELDTVEISVICNELNYAVTTQKKLRDLFKSAVIKTTDDMYMVLLGIENQ